MLIDGIALSEGSALQNLTVASGSSFPSDANVAELFYKTTDNLLYQYNGTAWVAVGGSSSVTDYSTGGTIAGDLTVNGAVSISEQTSSDPYFSNVVALLNFEGTVGTRVFTDESGTPVNWTTAGTATGAGTLQLQHKFGSTGFVPGGGNGVGYSVKRITNMALAGDFCIEFFFYNYLASDSYMLSSVSTNSMNVQNSSGGATLVWNCAGGTISFSKPSLNAWHHLALVRSAGVHTVYLDGAAVGGTFTSNLDYTCTTFHLGSNGDSAYPFQAFYDALRITSGNSRYTADFTPMTSAPPGMVATGSLLVGGSQVVVASQLGASNGVASLGSDAKILSSQLPALVIVDTYVAADEAAMLALSAAEQGDIAIRTDLSKTFILKTAGFATLANWQELLVPTDSVTGNAGTATALQTARAIALTGAVTGTVNFDGTANASIVTVLQGDTVVSKTFTGAVSVNYTTEGSYVVGNVTGATTLSITGMPDSTKAYGMTFELTNAGTNITWPASVAWLGTAPTLRASGVSMVTLVTRNGGTTWYGSAA